MLKDCASPLETDTIDVILLRDGTEKPTINTQVIAPRKKLNRVRCTFFMAVAAVKGEISVNSTQPLMIWMHKGLYVAAKSLIRQSRVRVEVEAQGWVVDNFFKLPVNGV